jgi:diamine N-acetyltransferase
MIVLRGVEPYDIDLLQKWENDTSVWKVSGTKIPFSRHILLRYIESVQPNDFYTTGQLRLMADWCENGTEETIGCVDLFDFDPQNRRVELGLLVDEGERRKKRGEALVKSCEKYVFEILQLHQLHSIVPVSNVSGLRLFQKMQYKESGILKDWLLWRGEWEDAVIFQKINTLSLYL